MVDRAKHAFDIVHPADKEAFAQLIERFFVADSVRSLSVAALEGLYNAYPFKCGLVLRVNVVKGKVTLLAHKCLDTDLPDPSKERVVWDIAPWEELLAEQDVTVEPRRWERMLEKLPVKIPHNTFPAFAIIRSPQRLATGLLLAAYSRDLRDRERVFAFINGLSHIAETAINRVVRETEHQRSAERYRSFLLNMPHIALVLDSEDIILDCNPRFERFLKRQREEIIGQPITRFLAEGETSLVAKVVNGQTDFSLTLKNSEGLELEVFVSSWSLTDAEGTPREIGLIAREYETASLQAAVQRVEEATAGILDYIPLGIFYLNKTGRITELNRKGAELLSESKENLIGKYFIDFVGITERDTFLRMMARAQVSNTAVSYSTTMLSGEREIPVEIRCAPAPERPDELRLIVEEITERLRAEEEIRKLSEFPRENPNPIFCVDAQGNITYQNQAMRDYLQSLGMGRPTHISQLFPNDQRFQEQLTSAVGREIIAKNREVSLGNRILLASFSSYKGAPNTYVYLQDITELKTMAESLKRTNEELLRLKEELEVQAQRALFASKQKSMYLANMSHELRTPLNSIIGFAEVLYDELFGELNEKQKEYVGDILESARLLLELIEEILDLAKIEAGKMELEYETFDVYYMLERCLRMVREKATKHAIELVLNVPEDIGEITADPRRFKQIVFNLLSNAVKFTPDGGKVGIDARIKDNLLEVTVWDTGIGISIEDQQRIFELFEQADGSLTRKFEGAGLGLAIVKNFVKLHGGEVWVESQLGHGSKFTFTIPVEPQSLATAQAPHAMDAVLDDTRPEEELAPSPAPTVEWDESKDK